MHYEIISRDKDNQLWLRESPRPSLDATDNEITDEQAFELIKDRFFKRGTIAFPGKNLQLFTHKEGRRYIGR